VSTAVVVVNTLAKAFKLVDDNTKVEIGDVKANAIPEGVAWTDLTGGAGPNSYEWEWRGPGLVKADFWFSMRLNWMYGSRYKGGGAYITACWPEVVAHNIWMPGYSIDIEGAVRDVSQVGSDNAPIAQISLNLSIKYQWASTWFGIHGGTCSFQVRGNGTGYARYDDMSYEP
jgi:hypothetical protein